MYDVPASIGWVKFSNWNEMQGNNLFNRENLKYGNRTTYRSIIVSYLPSRASLIIPSWSIMGSQNGEPKEGTFFVDWLSHFTEEKCTGSGPTNVWLATYRLNDGRCRLCLLRTPRKERISPVFLPTVEWVDVEVIGIPDRFGCLSTMVTGVKSKSGWYSRSQL